MPAVTALSQQEAGQMGASDYMHPSQKTLASLGASTDGKPTSFETSLYIELVMIGSFGDKITTAA